MAYVATRGGEAAIEHAHQWLAEAAMGGPDAAPIDARQVVDQLGRAVDRAMCEGALFDPLLAAQALLQAQGDTVEAAFLVRAWRATLARFAYSRAIHTEQMRPIRRVSAIYRDPPGGQMLGPTFDYTHRLLGRVGQDLPPPRTPATPMAGPFPQILAGMVQHGTVEPNPMGGGTPTDFSIEPLAYPVARDGWLQLLARADEGAILSLGYSTQRGFGNNHPFVGELRVGEVEVEIDVPGLGFAISVADITVTECQMLNQFERTGDGRTRFTRGYGLCFGHSDRKAMGMALVDRSLRSEELGMGATSPAQDQEFVLSHTDSVQAAGFIEHLKMPHYVDFQSETRTVAEIKAARHKVRTAQEAS